MTESVDKILQVSIQMKATEQKFPVVLFLIIFALYMMVLAFEFMNEVQESDPSSESYWVEFSRGCAKFQTLILSGSLAEILSVTTDANEDSWSMLSFAGVILWRGDPNFRYSKRKRRM